MRHVKQLVCIALIAICILCVAGCDASVKTIRLVGNASKGYVWDYESSGDAVLEEVGREYLDGNIPGTADAPGLFCFTFKSNDPGKGYLHFHYSTEGADGEEYVSTIVYDVTVDDNGKIVECKPIGASIEPEELSKQRASESPDTY